MNKFVALMGCLILALASFYFPQLNQLNKASAVEFSFPLLVHSFCNGCLLTFERVRAANSYQIYRSEQDGAEEPRIITKESILLDSGDLKENVIYTYSVSALDGQGKEISRSITGKGKLLCPSQSCSLRLRYQVGSYMYWVDEKQEGPMNAAPEIVQSRMFLVIRYVTGEVGAKLDWDGSQKKVTITTWNGTKIELWIDKSGAKINGQDIMIDEKNSQVVPYIKNGRTMLPMRFIAENLECKNINWDALSQTVTLEMSRPNCFDDNRLPLTMESFNYNTGKMVCIADFGATVDVMVMQGQRDNAKTMAAGHRIMVTSNIASQTDEKIEIAAIEIVPISQTNEKYFGAFKEAQGIDTQWIGCDGKVTKLKWGLSSMELISIPKGLKLWLAINKDVIIDYTVSTFEQPCKEIPNVIMNLKVLELYCKEKATLCEVIDKDNKIFLFSEKQTDEFCNLIVKQCYSMDCAQDQFGRLLFRTANIQSCPCNFVLETPTKSLFVTKGGDFEFSFSVVNKESEVKQFKSVLKTDGFAGEVSVHPEFTDVKPGDKKTFMVSGVLSDNQGEETSIEIGVSCGQINQYEKILLRVFEPMVEISEPWGILASPKEDQIDFSVIVKNTTVFNEFCKFSIDNVNAPIQLEVTPTSKMISSLAEVKLTFNGTWDMDASVGVSYFVNLIVKCGVKEFRKRLTLTVRKGGPTVHLQWAICDDDGKCELQGRVDWKIYEPKSITIDWGDDSTDVVNEFPAEHTYHSKGVYHIKVKAITKTGESDEAEISVEYKGVKPVIEITSHDFVQTGPHLFRLILEGKIDWRGLSKKRIEFDWGDGAKSEGNFPQVHDYTWGYYTLVISAEATTGEIGYFRVNVLIGMY